MGWQDGLRLMSNLNNTSLEGLPPASRLAAQLHNCTTEIWNRGTGVISRLGILRPAQCSRAHCHTIITLLRTMYILAGCRWDPFRFDRTISLPHWD